MRNEIWKRFKVWKLLPWFVLALLIVILDQWSKLAISDYVQTHGPIIIIENYFSLIYVRNDGAAFGFLSSASGWQRYFLAGFAILVCIWLIHMLFKFYHNRLTCLALSFVLGGAIGNIIDRVRAGSVIDFINWHIYDWHFPTFNIADIGITVGVALLLIEAFLVSRETKRARRQST